MAGLNLDPWQQLLLGHSLGEKADGTWAAQEVGAVVARQNGKGGALEGRELAGLYLLGEKDIVHSAHLFDTALEAMERLLVWIESTPDLDQKVKRVVRTNGKERIVLKDGARIRFRARTKGGGRGFTGDCLVLDEAMILPEVTIGSLMPTLSARPNTQVWYTGSAVDQQVHEHGKVFARVRDRGLRGDDPGLLFIEFSPPGFDGPDEVTAKQAADPELWAYANPGLGIRIKPESIERERRAMASRTFAVERLSIGDWPDPDDDGDDAISKDDWEACEDPKSKLCNPVRIALDVRPNRRHSSLVAAGYNKAGKPHVELIERRPQTSWVVERAGELLKKHRAGKLLIVARSPAASLIPDLEEASVPYEEIDAAEYGDACGRFLDAAQETKVVHTGHGELQAAALGARLRSAGDTPVWSRKSSAVDISPIVAATVAFHAATKGGRRSVYERRDLVVLGDDDD
ncbi:hypothetical protein [Patulibacter defluvii]|uniref:hypothetical protein n=1 Tax=Patulibacter defluvii TaxID=3095358 RepID=UPI002A75BF68|nr:hypothetical protein [Patulibacter sp. DM4]